MTSKSTKPTFHRYAAYNYHSTSGFQSVWRSLCETFASGKSDMIRDCHLYFLSKILQNSLLTRRYSQGLASLIGLSGKCETIPELFCMAGLEILKNIPHTHMLCLQYYKNMFLANPYNQEETLLNFALYLVSRQQDVTEGLELLKSKSSAQPFSQNFLHKAYIGLFEYNLWQLQQSKNVGNLNRFCEEDISDEEEHSEYGEQWVNRKVDFSVKHSVNLFEEVFSVPGVWDIFVPAYVDLLKHCKGMTQARVFLENYRDRNMFNPNAHRYLYHFLKSNSSSDEDLIDVLERLVKVDPTSECLGDLIDLKVRSGSKETIMMMIFQKLDHAGCILDEETWKLLESYLVPENGSKMHSDLKSEIDLCWMERESWWPQYHFQIPPDLRISDNRAVMLTKANVADYFLGKDNEFSREVRLIYREYFN